MLRIALAAALLLGAVPAFAQMAPDVATRTLEQNRRVVLGLPASQPASATQAAAPAPAVQAATRARTTLPVERPPLPRPLALAQDQGRPAGR